MRAPEAGQKSDLQNIIVTFSLSTFGDIGVERVPAGFTVLGGIHLIPGNRQYMGIQLSQVGIVIYKQYAQGRLLAYGG